MLAVPLIELEPPETQLEFLSYRYFRDNPQRQFLDEGLAGAVNPVLNIQMIDRDLRTPYQDELAFSFEREVAAESTIRLTYLNRRFEDQLQDIDANHFVQDRNGDGIFDDNFGRVGTGSANPDDSGQGGGGGGGQAFGDSTTAVRASGCAGALPAFPARTMSSATCWTESVVATRRASACASRMVARTSGIRSAGATA